MASKNARTNSTQLQVMLHSAAAFFNNNKTVNPPTATAGRPRRKPKPVVDLETLTQHPSIEIISNKEISIYVEMCAHVDEESTDIPALLAALPEYKSIKKLSLKIHAPWPHTESKEWHNYHVSSVKKLFAIIDKFNLYKLKVTMSIDKCNFPQMKLGAAVHSLRFKKWALYYQVYDEVKGIEEDPIKIFRGSEYDRRLRGVYRQEFLSYLK
ncbi:hypothetical protein OCU04_004243 [Sclerotinia nivalis]|uniref:Uncharacterized protein n=1 Tax=Sclerotinia nivalis TaxID=352851 RepID=A0A9X0AQ33_9HELO|nr:hypothetical protein OCU04_004243 [Sclerotinia nivalis]